MHTKRMVIIINILTIFSLILFYSCNEVDANDLNNNIKLAVRNHYGEVVGPINKSKIMTENHFSFNKIKKDWKTFDKTVHIDEERMKKITHYYKELAKSQIDKTKFSGWTASPLLHMFLNAYACTKKEKYLDDFVWFYNYFLSVRMDNKKIINYNGDILPQWERLDKYNIFNVSPYKKYPVGEKGDIIKQRGWQSLFFSDINYNGLFLDPILRFVLMVNNNKKLLKFKSISKSMLLDAEKVIKSFENEWVNLKYESGYYIFPINCPFYLDGVEMPVNEAAIFASSLVRAYLISKKNKYKKRALKMWNRWKKYMTKDKFGYIAYPYFTGAGFEGWDIDDKISINTPKFTPVKNAEAFHKAALTIDFLILLEQACPQTTINNLKEFYYVMIAALQTKTICSNFPGELGFVYPVNTYHSILPYGSRGWVHLSYQNEFFNKISSNYIINEPNQSLLYFSRILYFQYLLEKDKNDFKFAEYSEIVSPRFLKEEKPHCLWKSPIDGLVNIKFQHTSPKHNVMYLYDYKNKKRRIRLDVINGIFNGKIFVKQGECIDVRWEKSEHGAPKDNRENKITLVYYKKQ